MTPPGLGQTASNHGEPPTMNTTMPSAPMPDPSSTAIVDAAGGAFDNESMPLLNVLQDARARRKAARLAISPRDLVNVTVAGVGLAAASTWLGVEPEILTDRIGALTSGEFRFIVRALLAVA